MKLTVFTSNQPRHTHLVDNLANVVDKVYCVQECNTIFPGQVADFFKKSSVMRAYFEKVVDAERAIFGAPHFSKSNVKTLSLKSGDLNLVDKETLGDALSSDIYVVFGASFIKGWLIDFLVENQATNIHMGLSPYYRGSSCNFWAMYDRKPEYVGATIHKLSKGLDNGDILFHCLPNPIREESGFLFTMRAVEVAHKALVSSIANNTLFEIEPIAQSKSQEIRYTRRSDFTDDVAKEFLERSVLIEARSLDYPELRDPFFG